MEFSKINTLTYQLIATQFLPVPPETAFTFFEDPENLRGITPDWLDFRISNNQVNTQISEGSEFDYTIRWLGIKLSWRSKITEYRPPERFIDLQVVGPYLFWSHLHIFERSPLGTLMKDEVTYRLPYGVIGKIFHSLVIKKQLKDIFSYRAMRINKWAESGFNRKNM